MKILKTIKSYLSYNDILHLLLGTWLFLALSTYFSSFDSLVITFIIACFWELIQKFQNGKNTFKQLTYDIFLGCFFGIIITIFNLIYNNDYII